MAGFLAPQVSDIGAARGGSSAPADTSIGEALVGVSKIFDAAFASGQRPATATQKDRDSDSLRPFMDSVNKLQQQREALGDRQFQAKLNSAFSSFITANPNLVGEARAGVAGLTGIELGTAEVNLVDELNKDAALFLDTAEGSAMVPALIANSTVEGELDTNLFMLNTLAARAQADKDDAELAALSTQLGIEQARSGINEVRLKGVVDEWLFRGGKEAQADFRGIVQAAIMSGATIKDGAEVMGQLRDQRAALASRLEEQARAGGFANHPDWDVSIALRPYDNALEALAAKQEDIPRLFEALRGADAIAVGEMINGVTGVGGFQRDVVSYVFSNIIVGGSAELKKLSGALRASPTMATLGNQPLFSQDTAPVTSDAPPLEEGATTPEAKVTAGGLTRLERQEEVRSSLSSFGAYIQENGVDENYRATAVQGYTRASLAMTTSPQPTSEATFDQMYDTKFFDTYGHITKFGDEQAARLQNEVAVNLSTMFQQREKVAKVRLSNDFQQLPSFQLAVVDGEVTLAFNNLSGGGTPQEKRLIAALDREGFSRDLEGILKLQAKLPTVLGSSIIGDASNDLAAMKKEVKYLNKIMSTSVRLPEINEHLAPRIAASLTTTPTIATVEDYNIIWPNLEHGQTYNIVGNNGQLIPRRKGFEGAENE